MRTVTLGRFGGREKGSMGAGVGRAAGPGDWLKRLSTRERRLLYALIAAGVLGGTYLCLDWASGQRDRYAAAIGERAAGRRLATATRREAERAADPEQLREIDAASITAPNIWLARLKIERTLADAATEAGVQAPEIKVAEGLEGEPAAPLLRAELGGPYAGRTLTRLLTLLATSQETVVIQGLDAEGGAAAAFKLTVLYPVRISSTEGAR